MVGVLIQSNAAAASHSALAAAASAVLSSQCNEVGNSSTALALKSGRATLPERRGRMGEFSAEWAEKGKRR